MTATVILYIGFSLYNCLEKTTQTVWKTWKTQGISFCQICEHPVDQSVWNIVLLMCMCVQLCTVRTLVNVALTRRTQSKTREL